MMRIVNAGVIQQFFKRIFPNFIGRLEWEIIQFLILIHFFNTWFFKSFKRPVLGFDAELTASYQQFCTTYGNRVLVSTLRYRDYYSAHQIVYSDESVYYLRFEIRSNSDSLSEKRDLRRINPPKRFISSPETLKFF